MGFIEPLQYTSQKGSMPYRVSIEGSCKHYSAALPTTKVSIENLGAVRNSSSLRMSHPHCMFLFSIENGMSLRERSAGRGCRRLCISNCNELERAGIADAWGEEKRSSFLPAGVLRYAVENNIAVKKCPDFNL